MQKQLNRVELIELVSAILESSESEEVINNMILVLENNVPHPEVSDLLFYPSREMTAEEIVDVALAYKPVELR